MAPRFYVPPPDGEEDTQQTKPEAFPSFGLAEFEKDLTPKPSKQSGKTVEQELAEAEAEFEGIPASYENAPTDTLDRFAMSRARLVARAPFFGWLALKLMPFVARPIDMVATTAIARDGTFTMNPFYIDSLSKAQLDWVVTNAVTKLALLGHLRQGGRNAKTFSLARDIATNHILDECKNGAIEPPEGTPMPPQFKGLSAEDIYTVLEKVQQQDGKQNGGAKQQGNAPGQPSKGNGKGSGKGQAKGKGSKGKGDPGGEAGSPIVDSRDDLASTPQGHAAAKGSSSANKSLDSQWKNSVAEAKQFQQNRSKGILPLGILRLVEALLDSRLDWVELLLRWLGENGKKSDYSFARPSRRSESVQEYLPSLKKNGINQVAVLVDTSGSISDHELKRALTEINQITEDFQMEVRVLVCDAAVHEDVTIASAFDLIGKFKGGGGSDFMPAFDRLRADEFAGVVVAFTDGCITVPGCLPEHLAGMLWILPEGCKAPGNYGETVTVPRE